MTWFFRDLIGLEAAGEGETVRFQRLPTHRRDLLEVYAHEHKDARLSPDDADVVPAARESWTTAASCRCH